MIRYGTSAKSEMRSCDADIEKLPKYRDWMINMTFKGHRRFSEIAQFDTMYTINN